MSKKTPKEDETIKHLKEWEDKLNHNDKEENKEKESYLDSLLKDD